MLPTEGTYWFIPGYVLFWVLFAIALGLFAQRGYRLLRLLLLGQGENRFDHLPRRTGSMLLQVLAQACNLRSVSRFRNDLAGLGHAVIFWGFVLFLISYLLYIFVGGGLGLSEQIRQTTFSLYFSYLLDIAGLFILLAIIWAALRRYLLRPNRLEPSGEAAIILVLITLLMMSHFLLGGFEMYVEGDSLIPRGFLVYVPYSKHLHIFASPFNILSRSSRPRGALAPIDLEAVENFGASKIEHFTWKQLLDGYACAECGRCQDSCPAYLSGKPLSPKEVILDIKKHLLEAGPALLKDKEGKAENPDHSLVGDIITEEVLWECLTCRACQEECPVANEHIDKIIDMRRHLVLEQAKMPETAEALLKCIETRGHSCRGTLFTRTDWTEGLEVKVLSQDKEVDILYWVGCAAALEDRNMKVAAALARLLTASGVNFGILGAEESCCGEPARRLGNEYLFQIQALRNIETMKGYGVKRIVTTCPHCYNTIKHEYPQFGGEFEVLHHSKFIADLLRQGKVKPSKEVNKSVTYHDSCYLGRYNNIYAPPREILEAVPAVRMVEMERRRQRSFCCGGGGGCFWMEERTGRRINELRTEEAIQKKADIVATACPYCLQMFEDGIKAKGVEESVAAMDIVELLQSTTVTS
jgi:Fe-S oxidoreductase